MRSHLPSVGLTSLFLGLVAPAAAFAQESAPAPTPAPTTAAATATPTDAAASGQKPAGFVLGIALGTGPELLSGMTTVPVSSQALRGGLLIGYKFGRVMAHLGLEYVGVDQITGSGSRYGAVTFWLGVTGALWRSADQRVELIGSVRLGPGVSFSIGTGSNNPTALVGYELTPGLRYYLHPSVALQAQAGLGGQYFVTTGAGSNSIGVHSLAASLGTILVL